MANATSLSVLTGVQEQEGTHDLRPLSRLQRRSDHSSPSVFSGQSSGMRSFAQEKKSQQAPEIDALVRDRKVFSWCHKIN